MPVSDHLTSTNPTSDRGAGIHVLYCGGRVDNTAVIDNRSGNFTRGGTCSTTNGTAGVGTRSPATRPHHPPPARRRR